MRHISRAVLIAAVAACGNEPQVTQPSAARAQGTAATRYNVVLWPTLDGRLSRPSGINNDGRLAGFSNLPGDSIRHAALWVDSMIFDLGTLGGQNSNVQWPGISSSGIIAGISEINEPDTLHEEWSCTAFFPRVTGQLCRGFVWENGVMTELPTLGGNQGFAAGVNSQGQVVGWAETPVLDPTCNAPQKLQFRAVLWEPKKGLKQDLPPFPGDSTSAATAINEKGVAVGISGDCDIAVGQRSARRSVIWENGAVREIGNLGGDFWHTPMDINERGDVVGFSNPEGVLGIDFLPHGFLFTREGTLVHLRPLSDDSTAQAVGINERGEVVGVSSRPGSNRAVIWVDGKAQDLNALVGPGFPHRLIVAQHINDAGVITGRAIPQGTNRQVPFVATPIEENK